MITESYTVKDRFTWLLKQLQKENVKSELNVSDEEISQLARSLILVNDIHNRIKKAKVS